MRKHRRSTRQSWSAKFWQRRRTAVRQRLPQFDVLERRDLLVATPARFDFGSTSNVESNHTGINYNTIYSASPGYGWVSSSSGLSNVTGSSTDGLLRRDAVRGTVAKEFKIDVANGSYDVTVTMGHTSVMANAKFKLEGTFVDSDIDTSAGIFYTRTFRQTVSDGQLNVIFDDADGSKEWFVNGLVVESAASYPSALTTLSLDFGTDSSPIASGYERATRFTMYAPMQRYGWLEMAPSASTDSASSELRSDSVNGNQLHTFVADVANGTYNVTLTLGSGTASQSGVDVTLEGTSLGSISTSAGEYWTTTQAVTVSDGQLTLEISGSAWYLTDLKFAIPTDAVNDSYTIDQNQLLTVAAPGLLSNDSGQTVTISSADTVSASGATVSVSADGSYTYDPRSAATLRALPQNQTASDTFSYTASGVGGTDTATTTITVTGVNDAPTVSGAVTSNVTEDTGNYYLNLLTNASDVDTGTTLYTSNLQLTSGNNVGISSSGNSLLVNPSSYSYLTPGQTATISYGYTINDGSGGTVSQTATITITGVNHAPYVSAAVLQELGNQIAGATVPLLTGASDPDVSDALSVGNLQLLSGNGSGITLSGNALAINSASYQYLSAGQSETIQYSYQIIDSYGATVNQTATIKLHGGSADRFIDAGQPGFASYNFNNNGSGGFNGNQYTSGANSGGSATWTFSDLPAGTYDVFVTWNPNTTAANNAPFTILENTTLLSSTTVDQRIAPSGASVAGRPWQALGTVSVASPLTVRLSASATGTVLADAVRVVPHTPTGTDLRAKRLFGDGQNALFTYDVYNQASAPFNVQIYRSHDGVALDALLATQSVTSSGDLAVGYNRAISIPLNFTDVQQDYYLVAVVDAANAVTELLETNNRVLMDQGVFRTTAGVVQVHGTENYDSIYTSYNGTNFTLSLNGAPFTYTPSEVTSFHIRAHGGGDTVTANHQLPVWFWGGAGNDYLLGGSADDYLDGGYDSDVLQGYGGDDLLLGGADYDTNGYGLSYYNYNSNGGYGSVLVPYADSLSGGTGNDVLWGDAGPTDQDSGEGDVLFGEDGNDLLHGQAGRDTLLGGAGADTLDGGADLDRYDPNAGFDDVELLDGGQPNGGLYGPWYYETVGFNGDQYYATASAAAYGSWSFSDLPAGDYDVYATWAPDPQAAYDAPYTISHNGNTLATVSIDQRAVPPYPVVADAAWYPLGTYSVTTGPLVVRMDTATSGRVFDDAIRVVPHVASGSSSDLRMKKVVTNGQHLFVSYDVLNQAASAFNIGVYRSTDGITPGALLTTQRVTDSGLLALGNDHTVTVPLSFTDVQEDYYLVVKIDAASELTEPLEDNNLALVQGVFRAADGVVHIQGSQRGDQIAITQSSTLSVAFNNTYYVYNTSDVTAIHFRGHAGGDSQSQTSLTKPVWFFGGDGNDYGYGGAAADYLDGGQDFDLLSGNGGDDMLVGGFGIGATSYGGYGYSADYLTGGDGNDTLYGDSASGDPDLGEADSLYGDAGDDVVYGGGGADSIYLGDGNDVADGGQGWDLMYGGDGNDTLFGGVGGTNSYNNYWFGYGGYGYGGSSGDALSGEGGDDLLYGDFGPAGGTGGDDDYLVGGEGQDQLFDGAGWDTLDPGNGWDSPELLDDSLSGFTSAGYGTVLYNAGVNKTLRYTAANSGDWFDWQFSSLAAGQYEVWGTWQADPSAATNATYSLLNNATTLATYAANQRFEPSGNLVADRPWQLLGVVTYTSGTFHVRLDSSTTGIVLADAMLLNRAPSATADTNSVSEDGPSVLGNVLTNDTDGDVGDTKRVTHVNGSLANVGQFITLASGATLRLTSDGSYSYDPTTSTTFQALPVGSSATDTFSYTLADRLGSSSTATVTITINGANDAPVVPNASLSATEDGSTVTTSVLASDWETAPTALTYTILTQPNAGSVTSNGNGTFTFNPGSAFQDLAAGATRQVTFTFSATDPQSANSNIGTVTITVTGVNDAPVANNDNYVTPFNTALVIVAPDPGVLGNDSDIDGTSLSAVLVGNASHGTVSLSGNGTFNYTPSTGFHGIDSFTYRSSDGLLQSAIATVSILVNEPLNGPTTSGLSNISLLEDAPASAIDLYPVFADEQDADAQLTFVAQHFSGNFIAKARVVAGRWLILSPEHDAHGSEIFSVTATDTAGQNVSTTFAVQIVPVNDPPQALSVRPITRSDQMAWTLNMADYIVDPDGDAPLSFTIQNNSQPNLLSAQFSAGGLLVITPIAGNFGSGQLVVRGTDASGLHADIVISMAIQDVPTSTGDISLEVDEDASPSLVSLYDIFDDRLDADEQLTFAITQSSQPNLVDATIAQGELRIAYRPNVSGNGTITVSATNSRQLSQSVAIAYSIAAVNDPPQGSGTVHIQANVGSGPRSIPLSTLFSDVEDQQLSYSVLSAGNQAVVVPSLNALTGILTLVPAAAGSSTIVVKATDDNLATATTTLVFDVNGAPVLDVLPGIVLTPTTTTLTYDLALYVSDDHDTDSQLTYRLMGNTHPELFGSATLNGSLLTIQRAALARGSATLSIQVVDRSGLAAHGVIRVTAQSTSTTPTALGIPTQYFDEDDELRLIDLGNYFADAEEGGARLTYSISTNDATHLLNTAQVIGNRFLLIQPGRDQFGTGSLGIIATDATGQSVTSSVSIVIESVNDEPMGSSIQDLFVFPNSPAVNIALAPSFSDVDGELNFSVRSNSNTALVTSANVDPDTGVLTLVFPANMSGDAVLTVRATDPQGAFAELDFNVNVVRYLTPPVVVGKPSVLVPASAPVYAFDLTKAFQDAQDASTHLQYSVVSVSNPSIMGATIDASTRRLDLTFAPNQVGYGTITVRATDSDLMSQELVLPVSISGPIFSAPDTLRLPAGTISQSLALHDLVHDADDLDSALDYTVTSISRPDLCSASIDAESDTLILSFQSGVIGRGFVTLRATDPHGAWHEVDIPFVVGGPTTSGIANITITEDSPTYAINLWNAFADIEDADDQLVYTIVANDTEQLGATNIDAQTGRLLITPAANRVGTRNLTVRATDRDGLWVEAAFQVTLQPVNDPPTFVYSPPFGDRTIDEDTSLYLNLSQYIQDQEDGTTGLTYQITSSNPGLLAINLNQGNDFVTVTPTPNAFGTATITITATDSAGAVATTSFGLSVAAVNDAPIATTAFENWNTYVNAPTRHISLSSVFSDVEDSDAALSFTLAFDPSGNVIGSAAIVGDELILTLVPGGQGSGSARVTATDTGGRSVDYSLSVSVASDQAPTLQGDGLGDLTWNEDEAGVEIVLNSFFADPDAGDWLTYTIVGNTNPTLAGVALNGSNRLIVVSAPENSGTSTITVRATDSRGLFVEDSLLLTVVSVNDSPTATELPGFARTINPANDTVSAATYFHDVDSTLSYSVSTPQPAQFTALSIDPVTGLLTIDYASAAHGALPITVSASDGTSSLSRTFWVAVSGPVTSGVPSIDATEGQAGASIALWPFISDLQTSDSDLTIQLPATLPNLLSGASVDAQTGELALVFATEAFGHAELVLTVIDEDGLTVPLPVQIQLENVNDPPVIIASVPDFTVLEDTLETPADAPNLWDSWPFLDLHQVFADADHSALLLSYTITQNTNPALFSFGDLDVLDNRVLDLSLAPNAWGSSTITVRARDIASAYAEITFTIEVTPQNDRPRALPSQLNNVVLTKNDSGSGVDLGKLFLNVDGPSVPLDFSLQSNTNASLFSAISINQNTGIMTLTPAAGAYGVATLEIRATGGGGLYDTYWLPVRLNAPPMSSTPLPDVHVPAGQTSFSIDLSTAFTDPDDVLKYRVLGSTNARLFNSEFSSTGAIQIGIAPNAVGEGTLTIRATDPWGKFADTTVFVSVGDPPTTSGFDPISVLEDASNTIIALNQHFQYPYTLFYRVAANDNPDLFTSVTISPTGQLVLDYAPGQSGEAILVVIATTLSGESVGANLEIEVVGVNTAPVIQSALPDLSRTEGELQPIMIDLADVFFDQEDGAQLDFSISASSNPGLFASASIVAGQVLVVQLEPDASGTSSLTLKARDRAGLFVEETFVLNVVGVNDAPRAIALPPVYLLEDATDYFLELPGVFYDPEDDASLAYVATSSNTSLITTSISSGGRLTLHPVSNAAGIATITLRGTDSQHAWAETTFSVDVQAINDAPRAIANIPDVEVNEDAPTITIDLRDYFSDAETASSQLAYALASNSNSKLFAGITISPVGVLSLELAPNANGFAMLTLQVTDPAGASTWSTFAVRVAEIADAPTVITIPDLTIAESAAPRDIDLAAYFTTSDASQRLRYDVMGNSNPTLVTTMVWFDALTLRFAAGQSGEADLLIRATQADGSWTSATMRVLVTNVNTPPVVHEIEPIDVASGQGDILVDLTDAFLDNDTPIGSITYAVVGNSNAALFSSLSINNGHLNLTPAYNAIGTARITVSANDGNGPAEITFFVNMGVTNSAPTTSGLANIAATEDDSTATVNLAAAFADAEQTATQLEYRIVSTTQPELFSSLAIDSPAQLSLSFAPNRYGTSAITVRATDERGAYVESSFAVTVIGVNDAPTASDATYLANHDTPLRVGELSLQSTGLLTHALDSDGDKLTVELGEGPRHGRIVLTPQGYFTYVADLHYVGVDTFTYRATDGTLFSGSATATIEVRNTVPSPVSPIYTVEHDQPLVVGANSPYRNLLANLSDAEFDPLTSRLFVNVPDGHQLRLTPDGNFIYQSPRDFVGDVTFQYRIHDGISFSNPGTITIHVRNDAIPSPLDDSYTVRHDTPLIVDADASLLNNDGIDFRESEHVQIVDVSGLPDGHSLDLRRDGRFIYRPAEHFVGNVSFTYRLSDGQTVGPQATVNIQVGNAIPVLPSYDASYSTALNTTLIISSEGLLLGARDTDGDQIKLVSVSQPPSGHALTTLPNGSFKYVPPANFVGAVNLTYTVTDGIAVSSPRPLVINVVNGVVTQADEYSVKHDRLLRAGSPTGDLPMDGGTLLGNDTLPEGVMVTAVVTSPPSLQTPGQGEESGTLHWSKDGSFSYQPPAGYVGDVVFKYRLKDLTGGFVSPETNVVIHVTNVAPTSFAEYTVTHGRLLYADETGETLLSKSADTDEDRLTITYDSNLPEGLTTYANGSFQYQSKLDFKGDVTFKYKVSDGITTVDKVAVIHVTNQAPHANSEVFTLYRPNEPIDWQTPSWIIAQNDLSVDAGGAYGDPGQFGNSDHPLLVSDPDQDEIQFFEFDAPVNAKTWIVYSDVDFLAAGAPSGRISKYGHFHYEPQPNFRGVDKARYRVFDGQSWSDWAVIEFRVDVNATGTQTLPQWGVDTQDAKNNRQVAERAQQHKRDVNNAIEALNDTRLKLLEKLSARQAGINVTYDAAALSKTATFDKNALSNRDALLAVVNSAALSYRQGAVQRAWTLAGKYNDLDNELADKLQSAIGDSQDSLVDAYGKYFDAQASVSDSLRSALTQQDRIWENADNAGDDLLFQQIELAYSQFEGSRITASFTYEVALTNLLTQFEQTRLAAEQARDQIIATAQVTYNPTLAESSSSYQTALSAANDKYWQTIDTVMASFQAAVQSADGVYQQAIAGAESTYRNALATAEAQFNLSRGEILALYNTAYSEAFADRNLAQIAAQQTRDAEIAAAQSQYNQTNGQLQTMLATAQGAAQNTYRLSLATAENNYRLASASAQTSRDSAVNSAKTVAQGKLKSLDDAFNTLASKAQKLQGGTRESAYKQYEKAVNAARLSQGIEGVLLENGQRSELALKALRYKEEYERALEDARNIISWLSFHGYMESFGDWVTGGDSTPLGNINNSRESYAVKTLQAGMIYAKNMGWDGVQKVIADAERSAAMVMANRLEGPLVNSITTWFSENFPSLVTGDATADNLTSLLPESGDLSNSSYKLAFATAAWKISVAQAGIAIALENEIATQDKLLADKLTDADQVRQEAIFSAEFARTKALAVAQGDFDRGQAAAAKVRDQALATADEDYGQALAAAGYEFQHAVAEAEQTRDKSLAFATRTLIQEQSTAGFELATATANAEQSLAEAYQTAQTLFAPQAINAQVDWGVTVAFARAEAIVAADPASAPAALAWANYSTQVFEAWGTAMQGDLAASSAMSTQLTLAQHAFSVSIGTHTKAAADNASERLVQQSEIVGVKLLEHADRFAATERALSKDLAELTRKATHAEADAVYSYAVAATALVNGGAAVESEAGEGGGGSEGESEGTAEPPPPFAIAEAQALKDFQTASRAGETVYAKQVAEHELKRRQETWSAYGVQQRGLATAEFSYAVAAINPQRENALQTAQLNSDLTYDHAKLSAMNSVARMDKHRSFVSQLPPESFVSVGISIFEPQALWEVSGEAFMQWVEHGDLLDATSNFAGGFADTLTLGGTATLREWMGTDKFVDRTSFAYTAGKISGMVVSTIITSGAGVACGTGSWALQLARGYTFVTNVYQFGVASYNVYTGHGSWMDVLTIAMTVAGGIKYLRGGCFVGDTLVVLDDGRRLSPCGEVIADASTSSSFAGWQSAGMLTVLTVGVLGMVVAEDIRRREREEEACRTRQLTTPAWPANGDDEEEDEWLEALAHEHATEDSAWRESDDWLGADRERDFWDRTDDQAGSLAVVALPKLTRTAARDREAPAPQRGLQSFAVAPNAPTTAATAKSATRSSPRSWGILWLLLCLGICGAWKGTNWLLTPSKDLAAIGREVERPPLVTQKISEVPVGQWVLAENPELADEDFDPYEDLDPSQWRKLVLAMDKADGRRLDIDLLRPLEWLEEYGAVVDETIDLDLPELGAAGTATVVAIEPCPALAPRPSERHHLVTGKFRHQVDELIDLHIEGLDEPITCTPNHLFWSEDRQEFVPAGDITRGSSLRPFSGSVDFLVRREGRENDAIVYNLEVAVAHTYYVTDHGVLVHNACTRQLREAMNILRGGGHAHHIVPVGSFRGNADLIRARDVLERAGVSIESHYNGVMLPGAIHNKVHTNKYFSLLRDRLEKAESLANDEIVRKGLTGAAADNYRAGAAIGVLDGIKTGLQKNMTGLWK